MLGKSYPAFLWRRASYAHSLWKADSVAQLGGAAWLVISAYLVVRDEFIMPGNVSRWRLVNMLPHLSFAWWLVVSLVLVIVWLFEASFKLSRDTAPQLTPLQREALELADAFQEFLVTLGSFPEFDEGIFDHTVQGTSTAMDNWWIRMSAWEDAAKEAYRHRFGAEVERIVHEFKKRHVAHAHLDVISAGGQLPKEQFVEIPAFIRTLVVADMSKKGTLA